MKHVLKNHLILLMALSLWSNPALTHEGMGHSPDGDHWDSPHDPEGSYLDEGGWVSPHDCDMSDENFESLIGQGDYFEILSCTSASSQQIATVNQGNAKRSAFQAACERATGSTRWCLEVERPNPASRNTFTCTYGAQQPHRLIHPDEATWSNAFKAIELIQRLSSEGICVQQIYNWWRPEPYNRNVGGAAGRHPFGTAVDVRFCTNRDAVRAFDRLCEFRRRGEVRALGYYGSTGLHLGIGDRTANTWGRSCP